MKTEKQIRNKLLNMPCNNSNPYFIHGQIEALQWVLADDPEPITEPIHKPIISKVPECKNEPIDKALARIAGTVPLTVAAPEIKELLECKIKDSISKHYKALVDEYERIGRIKTNPSGFASSEILIKITKQNIITRKWVIEELERLVEEANNG